jgi:hypothetical protein
MWSKYIFFNPVACFLYKAKDLSVPSCKRGQTSMNRVRFESTIPVFERVKLFHALDRAATVIGITKLMVLKLP